MAYTKTTILPGDVITSAWGNSIQTQYEEAKADLDAYKAIVDTSLKDQQILTWMGV